MKTMLWTLMDRLRGGDLKQDSAIFLLLHLLAWRKATADGPREGVEPPGSGREHPDPRSFILHNLADFGRLELDGTEFAPDSHLFRGFSPLALTQLLEELDRLEPAELKTEDILGLLSEVRDGTVLSVPHDLAAFLTRLAGVSAGKTVYVPFASSFNLAVQAGLAGGEVFAEFETPQQVEGLRALNLLLGTTMHVRRGDPIREPAWFEGPRLLQFDVAVSCPPFGVRYLDEARADRFGRFPEKATYGEVLQIRHIQAQVRGRAVVLVANGLVFRTTSGERDFKATMTAERRLATVMALPGGLVQGTATPVSALVLEQQTPADRVLMVDAAGEAFVEEGRSRGLVRLRRMEQLTDIVQGRRETPHSRLVGVDEMARHDFNLMPNRYVVTEARQELDERLAALKTVPLKELADLIRPQALKLDDGESVVEEYPEVSTQDLGEDDHVQQPSRTVGLSSMARTKARQQLAQAGDILLVIKGSAVGRAAIVPTDLETPWLTNQSFVIVRLKPNKHVSDPVALLRYLTSPIGQALLVGLAGGATTPMLQTKDIQALPVAVPDPEELERVRETDGEIVAINQEIRRLKAAADALRRKHWGLSE